MDALPVMKIGNQATIVAGMIALATLTGCGTGGTKRFVVDNHIFNVPSNHLVQGTIPWLPAGQSDALKFVVNPDARPEEQMIVTIESSATTCHPRTPPASRQLSTACSAAEHVEENLASANLAVEKVARNDDPTQWEYRIRDARGRLGGVVASCYSLSEQQGGLCTALNNYGDLVYSVGLRDMDIAHLMTVHNSIHNLLHSWEQARRL